MTTKEKYLEAIKTLDLAKLEFYDARDAMKKAEAEHYLAQITWERERDAEPKLNITPELARKIKDAANRIAADSLKADHVLVPHENIQLVADELGVTFEEAMSLLEAEFKPKS